MIATMPLTGEYGAWDGPLKPSTEWRFHLTIMKSRPEVGGIVHTHSTFATALAIARKSIPAAHYMIAAFGGNDIRCADYATYGTKQLADNALKALEGRTGCLLANHGVIATGTNLDKAMWLAVELETIAKQYYYALMLWRPRYPLGRVARGDPQGFRHLRATRRGTRIPSVGAVEIGMADLGTVDLLVIGGGVNGAGIARDAVGRGLSVVLCEKGDLAEGTSLPLRQAGPRRPALSRVLRVPARARGADRARGAAGGGPAHHLADALRTAALAGAATGLDAMARPLPL